MTTPHLRRALRWPLWSWRNLSITSVVALAVLAGVGQLTTHPGSGATAASTVASVSPTPTRAGPATTPTAPPASRPSTVSSVSATSPTPGTATAAIPLTTSPIQVATAFADAWTTTTNGESAWLAGMSRWATGRLVDSLRGTDPTQVPATTVTGDAALVSTTGKTAQVSVPTDGGRIAVSLVAQGSSWKADALAPDDAPPAAPTPDLGAQPSTTGR